jgi:UDP-3-O-[3-hydroxymyristoyl] glucosamine N-acyltransferase
MPDSRFFSHNAPVALAEALKIGDARCAQATVHTEITTCAPLSSAGEGAVAFFSDKRYAADLSQSRAAFVFVTEAEAGQVPETACALITKAPQASWARLAMRLISLIPHQGQTAIHPEAEIEDGVSIGIGVVIGQGAQIGAGTTLEAYSVIGPGCAIGRNSRIGAHASVKCSLIGDRVQIASGARLGEAGFGVAGDARGLVDVPQLGRVIIQDDVSVGALTCIDRGAYDDTVIGEGSKIDNLVQIAHNVRIGRHCIIAAHSGISGSVSVGDGAMFGGRAGIIDHIDIGAGARVAAGAIVLRDVPAGEMWSGHPAKAIRQFLRESAWLSKQAHIKGLAKDQAKDKG